MFRLRKMLFLLLPLLLLIPALLIVGFSPGNSDQSFITSKQGGLGGAYGATSYPVAFVKPTPVPPKIYGGSKVGGGCMGTLGAGNDMAKMDFGWASSVLNKKWKQYNTYRLCNDRYFWETVTVLPVQTVLQTLQWPSDLLESKYANQVVTLQPLSTFDPVTLQAQQQAQQGNKQTSTETNKQCLWHISIAFVNTDIDICEPIRILVHASSAGIRGIYKSTEAQINFMWQTPLAPFKDDKTSGLLTIWFTSWSIVVICITATIAYGALRYMIGSAVNWLAYANIAELVTRLLFGLLAAYFSKEFFIMLIQANNALTGIFNHNSIDTVINGKASNVVDESLQLLYGLMGFCLMVEEIARMAILYVVFAFSPILAFFASLRETQRWAKTAAVGTVVFVFIQAAQTATLDVGGLVLKTVLKNTDGNLSFLNFLISLAILYLTLMLFFTFSRMAFGGGITPFANEAFGLSRSIIPFAAGAAGTAASAYGQARRNLFPLPGLARQSPGNFRGRMSGGPGNSGSSDNSNGSGSSQMAINKPSLNNGNNNNQSGEDASNGGASPGSRPHKQAGSGSPNGNSPAGSHAHKRGGPGSPNGSTPSRPHKQVSSASAGSRPRRQAGPASPGSHPRKQAGPAGPRIHNKVTPTSPTGQWQKTPLQTQRRMTDEELTDWLNTQDSH